MQMSYNSGSIFLSATESGNHTFSCRRYFSNLISRYVRFARDELSKGFMIFFNATGCCVI